MRERYFKMGVGKYTYKFLWHFFVVLCDTFGRIEIKGYENLPKTPCIFVANHVSFLDPFAMAFHSEKMIIGIARDTLADGKINGRIFKNLETIHVKRGQSGNLGAFRDVLSRIKKGDSVLIFPEGTRSPDGKLLEGKGGAGLLAIKSGVPIVPIRSFNLYDILPRSGTITGGLRATLCIGKPIDPKEIDPGKDCQDRAKVIVDRIMEHIASIEEPKVKDL